MAETKQAFLGAFSKPLPPGLGGVIQDLLVQQHFVRWGATGCPADPIALLGLRSVLEQVLAGVPGAVEIQRAFLLALQMDPEAIGATVQSLEEAALRRPALEALVDPEYQGTRWAAVVSCVAEGAARFCAQALETCPRALLTKAARSLGPVPAPGCGTCGLFHTIPRPPW